MTQPWRHLEGQVIGGKFRLMQYLGGSDHSAVFLTERPDGEPRKAAIKFVAARPEKAARQLSRWAEAEKISHPHLLRLFEMGQYHAGEENLLYLVMEHAEENLAQVVESRPLSGRECQEMLPPILEALGYLHRQGFVHGHLKPANVLAAQERVKLSCDGLLLAGEASSELGTPSVYDSPEAASEGVSPAGDVWSLGMTLVEVLTRKLPVLQAERTEPALPPSTPMAIVQVVRHCLCVDPKKRWTVNEIGSRLSPLPAAGQKQGGNVPQAARGKKNYAASVIASVLLAVIFIAGWLYSRPRQSAPPPVTAETPGPRTAESAPPTEPAAAPPATAAPSTPQQSAVVREVLPKVPKSARDTIHGTIRVRVRVALDSNGRVSGARFESAGPSKYFARLAMQAAQEWKFASPQPQGLNPANAWRLLFEFRRNSTHVIPTPISR